MLEIMCLSSVYRPYVLSPSAAAACASPVTMKETVGSNEIRTDPGPSSSFKFSLHYATASLDMFISRLVFKKIQLINPYFVV